MSGWRERTSLNILVNQLGFNTEFYILGVNLHQWIELHIIVRLLERNSQDDAYDMTMICNIHATF